MKSINIIAIVLFVVGLGIGFFAGMRYQQSKASPVFQSRASGQGRGTGRFGGMRPTVGEVISSDDKSITVKLQDGSSKIVIVSGNTTINKAAQATKMDLTTGERVVVFGTDNPDGSVTAQNIQINPQFRGIGASPSSSFR